MSALTALADLLDPPPVDGVESWLCDRTQCDGKPHGDYPWNHARTKQRPPPGVWFLWMILAGRGFGKTRTVSEWLADQMQRAPASYWAWVAPTFDDGRDIGIEGESGMLYVLDRLKVLHDWNRSLGHLILRKNQARLDLFSAEKPESLRGPNLRGAVGDEPATWKYPDATWSNLMLMVRIGQPRIAISGTPKPTRFVRGLQTQADHLVTGDTYENRANLADIWFEKVILPLEGTALGQQEIYARILDQAAGALWAREWLRIQPFDGVELDRVRVAWDPAITSTSKSDAHGIIAVGQEKPTKVGVDGRGKPVTFARRWVLADRSGILTPDSAAKRVVRLALEVDASKVYYEPNQGGDVWAVLYRQAAKDLGVKPPAIEPKPAVGNKESRAAPVSAMYEQQHNLGRLQVIHVPGLEDLEMEMCTWEPGVTKESPNRVDALSLGMQSLDRVAGTSRAGNTARAREVSIARRPRRGQITFGG